MTELSLAAQRRPASFRIVGTTVIVIIFLEKFGGPDWVPLFKWMMLGALVAGVGIPMLLCRRPVQD